MGEKEKTEGMLSPYRVLDMTDEKGLLCGKILGDLGANVIKIEKPGGDPARNIGPFYHDEPNPEKSLFWFALNTNKRGITLDIETIDGKEIFKKLVRTADFIIESFPSSHMDKLELGYLELQRLNPGIILVSITPFGQTGPYKAWKAPDIVAWAMGGYMYTVGDLDRSPVRISHHSQAYLHAAGEAAGGALIALYYREMTGEGQQVDVSIQDSVVRCITERVTSYWDMIKHNPGRGGRSVLNLNITRVWPCKDGHVCWYYWGGPYAKRANLPFIKWMESEGMADDFLKNFDWDTFNLMTTTQDIIDRISQPTAKFFMAHTKAELYAGALKHGVQLFPVSNNAEILEDVQLTTRGFWVDLEHPELGTTITYPGAFAKTTEMPPTVLRRAPLIGEHNQEIYNELGFSKEDILSLKQAGII